jgi:hypothetical protein
MREIFLYSTINSWVDETPDATIRGVVNIKTDSYIEFTDENGYTQIINLDRLFAVVY